ncbi:chemotaxis response regulator protein-glutamate methylesterase [Neptuniibacter sp.]|uniref:protein-glutamate methylesterase/protein-glutamine glutaminase n=1 Tax=Neptuniibacter sp. TaxID=1962643 RepID=UPI00263145C5|nr:chemotaxis response regulator protein-glutamate methylesterase [Neptuniibacter sp.]MCP4595462.1 chemotaxis response regulator protein-glutamate methylesterase [Neptuniibacter sp.]
MDKTRVLIVDDSAVVRSVLTELLSMDPAIEVVGAAEDPYDARGKIKELKPDVLTLDIEMPKMDGITFLKNLMKLNPMPVVMLSSLTHEGAESTLQALELGAIDYMPKPTASESDEVLKQFQEELVTKVKTAAGSASKLKFRRPANRKDVSNDDRLASGNIVKTTGSVIAIGSSTGGTEALRDILEVLHDNLPPIVITQHIPASFSERFANRLDSHCQVKVKEAEDGDILKPGCAYIAPGSNHLSVKMHGHQLIARLDPREAVNRHKPSVEVMFDSLHNIDVNKVTAIMLTGMGEDGSMAMKRLADAGAHTIVQDEATSLVWGMPGMAVKYGAAKEIVPLNKIAKRLIQHLSGK